MDDDHPNILHGPPVPLDIPKITLGQFIFARLKSHNPYDVLMVEADSGRLNTPLEFLTLSVKVAQALKSLGLRRGDVVSIIGKAKIDVYATATGVLFQGGTVCPVDHNLSPDVFLLILQTASPKFVFCDSDLYEGAAQTLSQVDSVSHIVLYDADPEAEMTSQQQAFERFVEAEVNMRRFRPIGSEDTEESLAFLVCSSGTMGTPKLVKITDRNLMHQATVWGIITSFNKFFRCPAIGFSYFFWISGVLVYMMVVCMDFEMTIVQKLEGRHILEVIERQKPVWGMFSPALVKYLNQQPDFNNYNVSSLMVMITGGSSLPQAVVDRVRELWGPQVSCKQSYGVTELAGSATASSLEDDVQSVGRLLPGFHMKIVSLTDGTILPAGQEGEIHIKSPSVMKGYLGNDKATEDVLKDGWYNTGDMGTYNEKGLLYITGRVRDFFRSNHELVSPLEIEEVLLRCPGVADAGVVGVAVDEENHHPVGLVVRAPGFDVAEEDVIKWAFENLPESKRVRRVYFVEVIPRTGSGKVKRADLLARAKALLAREGGPGGARVA